MAPDERRKPARLQKQIYSLDIPKEEEDEKCLQRSGSVIIAYDNSLKQTTSPSWLRKSRDKLGKPQSISYGRVVSKV